MSDGNFETGEQPRHSNSPQFRSVIDPRAARARAISSSTCGSMRRHDHVDAGGIRMQAVGLVELGIGGHAVEKKRIKDDPMSRGKRRIDGVEGAHIIRRPCCAAPACRQARQQCDARRACSKSYRARSWSAFGSTPRSMSLAPSSRITASVPCRHRPVEPAESAGGGVAGDAGIGDVDRDALGFERLGQLCRERRLPGSPRPALSESPSTTILTGRSSAAAPPAAGSAQKARQPAPCAQAAGPGRILSHMSGIVIGRTA